MYEPQRWSAAWRAVGAEPSWRRSIFRFRAKKTLAFSWTLTSLFWPQTTHASQNTSSRCGKSMAGFLRKTSAAAGLRSCRRFSSGRLSTAPSGLPRGSRHGRARIWSGHLPESFSWRLKYSRAIRSPTNDRRAAGRRALPAARRLRDQAIITGRSERRRTPRCRRSCSLVKRPSSRRPECC